MHGLEKGVHLLATQETNQKLRTNAIDMLNGVINDIKSGIDVWNQFIKSGGSSTKPGSYGGWAGFEMDNQLWEIELQARDKAREASNGGSSLDEPLVAQSNVKLAEEQGDMDYAQAVVSAMEDRIKRIKALIDTIKKTKPKKPAAAKKAKTTAKKATTKKKTAKKKAAAKKSAKKKPAKKAKKKAVKKKAVKKKVVKKAPTKKKAAKKKVSKKKAVKKKATKKKAAKKKATKKKATAKKKKAKKR